MGIFEGFHSHGGTDGWFIIWTIPLQWMISIDLPNPRHPQEDPRTVNVGVLTMHTFALTKDTHINWGPKSHNSHQLSQLG